MRKVILLVTALGVLSGSAWADGDSDAVIAYRKSVMEVMGNHLKAMASILKGSVPFASDLNVQANGLTAAAAISLKSFEPKVTEGRDEKTTAKPEIWSDFGRFTESMHRTEADTAALKAAVDAGDKTAVAVQLAAVGKDCKSCHDDTRSK